MPIEQVDAMERMKLPRRFLLASGASLLATWPFVFSPWKAQSAEEGVPLTETQRYSLWEALKETDPQYDPAAGMIASSVSSVGYHTTLKEGKVHSTRSSLEYAVALLDSGEPERLERARDILKAVIALQDQKSESPTYGIWPWYLEEPLEKMSPPDWNWADFCGVQLLAVWIDHRSRLGKDDAERVRESILHAAQSIQRRNVGPGYTNIALMGTYVTLVTSERFEIEDLRTYAQERLRRNHRFLFEQGSFNEYNSPTYTIVAIKELARMLMHVRDEEDRKLIREIYDFAWNHAACRFHEPTRQWAGPHSRCYATLLRNETKMFLESATGERGWITPQRPVKLGLSDYRLTVPCPESFITHFQPLKEPKTVSELFIRFENPELNVTGTTYLHPLYALGTASRSDCWNQRRAFVAYWGKADRPAYLHLRFLHDGYDYASALPFTLQHKGCALTGLVFATDYGDTHPSLDRVKNGTIRAKDLRLRFEFGGDVSELVFVPYNGPEGMLFLHDRDIQMQIRPLLDPFGQERFRWEIGQNDEKKWIDAIAYSGEEKEIDFTELQKANLIFAFQLCGVEEKPVPMDSISVIEENGWSQAIWDFTDMEKEKAPKQVKLHLEVPESPGKRELLFKAFQRIQKNIQG